METGSSPIRVGIADDHAIVRRGLRQTFEEQPDIEVVGEARDGRAAVDLVRRKQVDVLLLDMMMPELGGLEAITLIRAKSPKTAVVVLSTCPEEQFASKMMRLGACTYLNKQCEPDTIVDAVRVAARGDRYVTPAVEQALLEIAVPRAAQYPHERLTEREFQLLLRLARGQGTSEIAEELSLSKKTMSTYRNGLLAKLGLRTNSEITHYAMIHRLID